MKKILISVSVIASLLAVSCTPNETPVNPLHCVLTTTPIANSNLKETKLSGVVNENATVNLGFKTAGQIEKIYVKEGSRVKKGQLLAELDSKDYALGLQSSEAKYKQMTNEIARLEQLYKDNTISGNDYEKAVAGYKQLEVQLLSDRNKVAYTKLYAPEDGVVVNVNFEPAEMVNAGTPVFNIMSSGKMKVEVNLPLNVYQQRDKIASASCVVDGKNVALQLISVTPKADDTQLYKALFRIVDSNKNITAGMNVNVMLSMNNQSAKDDSSVMVPLRTVFEEDGKSYVWVIGADSVIAKTNVVIGSVDPQGMVSVKGLKGGETIVKAGVHSLNDGEKVKPIAEESETNVGGQL